VLAQLGASRVDHEVARAVHFQPVGAGEVQRDGARVGAGNDDKVVFELLVGAVVDQVDAWGGRTMTLCCCFAASSRISGMAGRYQSRGRLPRKPTLSPAVSVNVRSNR
jgi:hypothetical protein